MLLASIEKTPRMLTNILQCTEQSPTMKNYPASNADSAALRNPVLDISTVFLSDFSQ